MGTIPVSKIIEKVKELESSIHDMEVSLGKMRSDKKNWEEDITKDERPSVKILYETRNKLKQQLHDLNCAVIETTPQLMSLL